MCHSLATDRLPDRRIVVRFDFTGRPRKNARFWLLIEHRAAEVCASWPGEEDLIVIADPERFVRWHMGHRSWAEAAVDGGIVIQGPPDLAAAFPSLNRRSHFAHIQPHARAKLAASR